MTGADLPTLTLRQLSDIVVARLNDPSLRMVWIVAETSDVAVRGGHCYLELLDKNPADGSTSAKARAVIWSSRYMRLAPDFFHATGQPFGSGIKIRVLVTVDYHPVYGFKLVVSDIDPAYTLGEAVRRRREILARLEKEGLLEMNRSLTVDGVPLRVAVISAAGAAGYGDFVNQLFNNRQRLRFNVKLFPAIMQGDRTAPTVISALEEIAAEADEWDCVVIIRGGGATSDLEAFDNYDLAANVAGFPLPVIVGIGHERDVTVLDYVAFKRVKTPTAAAEWLVARGREALDRLIALGSEILAAARDRFAGATEQLARLEGAVRLTPPAITERNRARLGEAAYRVTSAAGSRLTAERSRLDQHIMQAATVASGRLTAASARLDALTASITPAVDFNLRRATDRLDTASRMIRLLSPEATLRRGYSITRCNGRSVSTASALRPGDEITTVFADGTVTSTVKPPINQS